jgi:hypothetical protein
MRSYPAARLLVNALRDAEFMALLCCISIPNARRALQIRHVLLQLHAARTGSRVAVPDVTTVTSASSCRGVGPSRRNYSRAGCGYVLPLVQGGTAATLVRHARAHARHSGTYMDHYSPWVARMLRNWRKFEIATLRDRQYPKH